MSSTHARWGRGRTGSPAGTKLRQIGTKLVVTTHISRRITSLAAGTTPIYRGKTSSIPGAEVRPRVVPGCHEYPFADCPQSITEFSDPQLFRVHMTQRHQNAGDLDMDDLYAIPSQPGFSDPRFSSIHTQRLEQDADDLPAIPSQRRLPAIPPQPEFPDPRLHDIHTQCREQDTSDLDIDDLDIDDLPAIPSLRHLPVDPRLSDIQTQRSERDADDLDMDDLQPESVADGDLPAIASQSESFGN